MIHIALIVNYAIAFYMLWVLTNDDIWSTIMRDMKFGKDLTEQQRITETEQLMRKVFCWLMIIPGAGILMLINMIRGIFDRH